MSSLPNGWDLATRTQSNGQDVSGALEIAGDEMNFPKTGALVRAVPLKGEAGPISIPGDTLWKGASGKTELQQIQAPPPDIKLECHDGGNKEELTITWDMSWSDVLDLLRSTFKRACVFQYDGYDAERRRTVRKTVASESEFDHFCSYAEKTENFQVVWIIDATFTPSEFIRAEVKPPMVTNDTEEAFAMTTYQEKGVEMGIGEEDAELPVPRRKREALMTRLQDAPIPITHTIAFGVMGLLVSIAAVVLGYMDNLNTLGAVALALPVNMFVLSFFVSAVEDGVSSLVRLGVGFCGFFCAIIVISCYSITRELVALGSAFLFLFASFYYLELNVRARGWTTWFQGLYNLFEWFRGGCPLVGVRIAEAQEDITILGPEPPLTFGTALLAPEERYPGVAEWRIPKVGDRVKHIGKCLQVLSESGFPMGPWEEGIIHKKTARQLRKWLVRNGQRTEEQTKNDFEKWALLPAGKIVLINSIGHKVEWDNGVTSFYSCGEDNVYELVLYEQDAQEAEPEMYKDGQRIHSGGGYGVFLQTFLAYFLRKFCAFLWYWIAFLSYFLMLYTFEFSLTNFAVYQAIGGASYSMDGGLYNVRPGNDVTVHIHCKGVLEGVYDGRPPVIMESMEGIGQGLAMARLQDLVAQRGVACVYDRVGFGFSSDMEDTSFAKNRTPDAIVSQLAYALINGTNIKNWRPVTWTRQGKDELNRTIDVYEPVKPPFVMLGHSAGGLYARLFAARFPEYTAGLVLVDPLPAENDGIPSIQQKMLSPFLMTLCTRFLQPVGLIYTFFPTVVSSLFSEQTRYNLNNESSPEPLDDFQKMTSRMFERQWCPSVLAEWNGLYSGEKRGIDVVAEVDRQNYTVPTLIWVRDKNRLDGATSRDAVYKWDGFGPTEVEEEEEEQVVQAPATESENTTSGLRRRGRHPGPGRRLLADVCDGCVTWEAVQLELLKRFENSWINPFTAERDIMRGDPASCAAAECTEYTPIENSREILDAVLDMWNMLLYNDVSFSSKWTVTLVRQEDTNGMIAFDQEQFKCDLAVLLRHIGNRGITVIPVDFSWDEVPTALRTDHYEHCRTLMLRIWSHLQDVNLLGNFHAGAIEDFEAACGPLEADLATGRAHLNQMIQLAEGAGACITSGGCTAEELQALDTQFAEVGANPKQWFSETLDSRFPQIDCAQKQSVSYPYVGYSGDADFGDATYRPFNNKGTISFLVRLVGHKDRAVGWAQDNLRGTENTVLDGTARVRRTTFLHQWQVLGVVETVNTTDQGTGITTSEDVAADLFSSEYSSTEHLNPTKTPEIYKCPQNTYPDGRQCLPCALEKTSRSGSQAESDCFACRPLFDESRSPPTWRYFYLNCTGVGCAECPNGTLSSAGALGIADCRPVSGFNFYIKGPLDTGSTSQAVEPHRTGREVHTAFDTQRFREILSRITSISLDRIVVFAGMPRDVPDYPGSRCMHMRGGCMFQVGFSTQAESSQDLERATRYMLGLECIDESHSISTHPHCFGEDADPKDTNLTRRTARTDLFNEFEIVSFFRMLTTGQDSGSCPAKLVNLSSSRTQVDIFQTDFIEVAYDCPSQFYKDAAAKLCLPCPDMTTSDPGSAGAASCAPFNTFILVGKDASLSYQARTNPSAGGLTEARPNALKLHNDLSYIKIRGYALHINELVDATDEDRGYQWAECPVGLNCFNSTHFRTRVSEVTSGSVRPNEVRLTQPHACSDDAPVPADALNSPSLSVYTLMCGPWPGFPTTKDEQQCVEANGQTYVTGGRYMIGDLIGGELIAVQKAVTAGACAEIANARLSSASFLYDPNTLDCHVRETYLGDKQELCPSTSQACIDRACASEAVCPIIPGMQLYWNDNSRCKLKTESDQCTPSPDSGVVERRSSYPLDAFYVMMNLHAETKSEIEAATKILTEGSGGATGRLERESFLREYQVIRLLQAEDKQPVGGEGREGSLNHLITSGRTQCTVSAGDCMTAFSEDTTFVTMQEGNFIYLEFGNSEGTVLQALVTRVDITLVAEAPENLPVDLLLEFSDGNTRTLSLAPIRYDVVGDLLRRMLAFYIEPVVTHSVRISPIFHGVSSFDLAIVDLRGQLMSDILSAKAVNLFQANYVNGKYKCPSTTTRLGSTGAKTCDAGQAELCSCEPCPYPLISNLTGQGACSCPTCGDGRLNWQVSEECDDGNVNELDGCSSNCLVENLQMCEGEKDPDTFVGLPIRMYDKPDSCLRLGSFWTPFGLAGWSARYGTAAVIHKNAMWIIAGIGDGAVELYNDVWFEDTNGWNCVASEPEQSCVPARGGTDLVWGLGYPQTLKPQIADYYSIDIFPPRGFHGAVSLQGYIWVTGGIERRGWQGGVTEPLNCPLVPDGSRRECQLDSAFQDVWRTTGSADAAIDINRVSWELVTQNAAWDARGMHGFLVYKQAMWVIGGREYITGANRQVRTLSDVWSSTDGVTWEVATINPAWRSRAGHGVTLDQDGGFMYITGGRHDEGSRSFYLNDVWRSENGVTWLEVTAHAGWHGRWLHRSILFQNSMWVIGGQHCGADETDGEFYSDSPCRRTNDANAPPSNYGDVWVSVNKGEHWDEATASAKWNRRSGHALVVFDTSDLEVLNGRQNLWILGGMDGFDTAHNDSLISFEF